MKEGGKVKIDIILKKKMDRGKKMEMEKKKSLGVKRGEKIIDIRSRMEERKIEGKREWREKDEIKEKGD